MESLAKELGVKFQTNANIEKIIVENKNSCSHSLIEAAHEKIDNTKHH
jgi:phytoene dehydrogenase-like protein